MQTSKIRAPIAVQVEANGSLVEDAEQATCALSQNANVDISPDRLRAGWKRLQALVEATACQASAGPLKPRRLQTAAERSLWANRRVATHSPGSLTAEDRHRRTTRPPLSNTKWHAPKTITPRLVRRRMQDALAQAPLLTVRLAEGSEADAGVAPTVRFDVARHPAAKGERGRFRRQNDEEAWWQQEAARLSPHGKKSTKKR